MIAGYLLFPSLSNVNRDWGWAVLLESHVRDRVPDSLVSLGDASYAICLLHNPQISLTSRAAAKIPVVDRWAGSLIFSMICVIGSGLLFHLYFERPALGYLRKVAKTRTDMLRRCPRRLAFSFLAIACEPEETLRAKRE